MDIQSMVIETSYPNRLSVFSFNIYKSWCYVKVCKDMYHHRGYQNYVESLVCCQ